MRLKARAELDRWRCVSIMEVTLAEAIVSLDAWLMRSAAAVVNRGACACWWRDGTIVRWRIVARDAWCGRRVKWFWASWCDGLGVVRSGWVCLDVVGI